MTLTIADVIQATGATALKLRTASPPETNTLSPADLQREMPSVMIDSRTVRRGSLFIALKGERTDGHAFVGAALRAGALGCLVVELPPLTLLEGAEGYLLQVPDTLTALQRLAAHRRSQFDGPVIGVTGSIGKTTAKEIIAGVLAARGPVLRNAGNLNTEIGLPLTLIELAAEHRVAVLEMGMYAPGDIALLARITRPEIGVVTNVAPIHLERLGTIERIARAKSELVAALPTEGLAVLNGDDPWTRAMAETSGIAPSVLVGFAECCHYRAASVVERGLEGVSFVLHAEGRSIPLETRVPGGHLVHAFLAAAAIGRHLGMEWAEVSHAVEAARVEVRQRILRDRPGVLIIDDSYNSAPMSIKSALSLLRASPGQHVAVLGDMLELGPGEESAHREVGAWTAEVADWLVARGPRAGWIAESANRAGMPETRIRRAATNAEAARAVLDIVTGKILAGARPGPTMPSEPEGRAAALELRESIVKWSILVKGSRGMEMEEVVERLRSET
jgi:UDP-N-acetylmuramoyl-tripeptide--D-alanyl-D-alanine ligase